MPRCSHGTPFENKCDLCFKAAMTLYPSTPRMPTYPVQVALRQTGEATLAYKTVRDRDLVSQEKA